MVAQTHTPERATPGVPMRPKQIILTALIAFVVVVAYDRQHAAA
jgi:hypothetical protein